MTITPEEELRQIEYDLRLRMARVMQSLNETNDPAAAQALLDELAAQQENLSKVTQGQMVIRGSNPNRGVVLETKSAATQERRDGTLRDGSTSQSSTTRGGATTGLSATARLRMTYVPTAIYHLLDENKHPLVECEVKNSSTQIRRVRVSSYIEGYTAPAIESLEIEPGKPLQILQLPTLFPERVRDLNELTRATLNVQIDDLDGKVELHKTVPIWLLARNAAPLYVRDPATGGWNDLTRYLGAFVTPNAPAILRFLRRVVEYHPQKMLFGYQADRDVEPQVRAIFEALRQEAKVTYVNSTITFNPEQGARSQRVRLPRQSLDEQQANCIDGTLLFASLLEAASLNPALVIIPGHAFVGWSLDKQGNHWDYLETTAIGDPAVDFDTARQLGRQKAVTFEKLAAARNDPLSFRRWSLRNLRTELGITPLE